MPTVLVVRKIVRFGLNITFYLQNLEIFPSMPFHLISAMQSVLPWSRMHSSPYIFSFIYSSHLGEHQCRHVAPCILSIFVHSRREVDPSTSKFLIFKCPPPLIPILYIISRTFIDVNCELIPFHFSRSVHLKRLHSLLFGPIPAVVTP